MTLDKILAELENDTNQTWVRHRFRWASFVRAQAAQLERLQAQVNSLEEERAHLAAAYEQLLASSEPQP